MLGWYIVGIILLAGLLLWDLPLAVEASWGEELCITARIGPKRLTLLPKAEKPAEKKKKEEPPPPDAKEGEKKKESSFTLRDIKGAVDALLPPLCKALRRLRKALEITPLKAAVVFGGGDPADLAEMYGWANAAVWTWMPQLERLLHIPDPHIHLRINYEADATYTEGCAGAKIHLGAVLVVGMTVAIPALRWYLGWRKEKRATTKTV